LENVFSTEITGVDAVFESNARSVSYTIINGKAHYTGEGKLYDRKYEDQQLTIQLADPGLFTTGKDSSPRKFTFTLTPNDDFYDVYSTPGPAIATAVVICSVLLTILVFFLYDFFVRREFHAKQELLEARRQFMRFVSHEVRTPLNAVSMGLDLMQSEVAQALGFDSAACLNVSSHHDDELLDDENHGNHDDENHAEENLSNMIHDEEASASAGPDANNGSLTPTTLPSSDEPRKPLHTTPSTSTSSSNPRSNKADPVSSKKPTDGDDSVVMIPPHKAREWFHLSQEIQSNAQGAVDILNDLLNYDKIEQGTLQLGLDVVCVWQLLEKVILEFKLPASSKEIRLRVAFGGVQQRGGSREADAPSLSRVRDLPDSIRDLRVIGDFMRLTQVLRNLMSNALKFTPANGSVNVEAFYQPEKAGPEQMIALQKGQVASGSQYGYIKVRVTDTGAGMSPDQVVKLFQDGVQFNANELQAGGGSGLGLYIAKGIVKQHNGALTASSEGIGRGTAFELLLPLWKVLVGDFDCCDVFVPRRPEKTKIHTQNIIQEDGLSETQQSELAGHSISSFEKKSLKILVVDVKSNRKLLIRLLENIGHQCEQAENGQLAVEMVKKASSSGSPYDSILLDYEMPIMDGPTAAKEIRQYEDASTSTDVNIVGITGNVLPEDVSFFRSCGADDVLAKPVKMPDLLASWMEHGVGADRY
jgi:signal transduction histidine kinase/CheY-like chemotaxis protein